MGSELLAGRYMLGALAGAGAMGNVYRARDVETGQQLAVKVMSGKDDDAARFAREARVLAQLGHRNIVAYVDHGTTTDGHPWLAMEWLEGEDLAARLAREPLSRTESVALGALLAQVLDFVHTRGVVHRDLKPSNIFLVNKDVARPRVLDFGIARVAAEQMTQHGRVLGTPGYMAPEQVQGASVIDARADIYSLGCLLFECLTGEPLYSGTSLLAILAKVVLEPAPRLAEFIPDIPDELDRMIATMLAKDFAERPVAAAVADALRGIGDLPAGPAATKPPQRSLTGSERRPVAVILVAGGDEAREEAEVQAEAARHGGHFVRLPTGAIAIELTRPTLATDLAVQAARCALALRVAAKKRPVVLAFGRDKRGDERQRGAAIDRAAQLLALPEAGEEAVLLDEVQAGLLDARFDVGERGGTFVLRGERGLSDNTRTLLGKATPCVGRDRELGTLGHLFESCVEERAAAVVLVTAQAGTGKSRLAQEFLRETSTRHGVAPWIGRGDPLRAGSAFGLLGQILRTACGVRDRDMPEVRRAQVRACVEQRIPVDARERVAEFVGEIVGASFPDDASLPLRAARRDASLMNEQLSAAFLTFLAAECERGPVLIVLEDLHWGDEPTVAFLGRALQELREHPLFVLALARPEVHELYPRLWADRGLHELHLKQLSERAISRLAHQVLGDEVSQTVVTRLARLSEGNAFFLEELIRWSAEHPDGSLPETVVTMVQSRLGSLDDDARSVLRVASVFGEVFWASAVTTLLGGRERTTSVRDRLQDLAERELLIRLPESRFPGEDEYAFRHVLLREGAYAMLTDEDRSLGHRLAGEWLDQRGERDALVLAEHFELGADGPRAAQQYLAAARRASAGSDTTGALACIERGLALPLPRELRNQLLGMRCELHMYRVELADQGLADPACGGKCATSAGHLHRALMTGRLELVVGAES